MKTYKKEDITAIIDSLIKQEMERKNAYIQKNGYSHRDIISRFDSRIAAFSEMYGKF